MGIGARIRKKRVAEGLSQEHLARRADISLNVLNRIETGAVTNPHFATVVSLAEALNSSVGELAGDQVLEGKVLAR